MQWKLKEGGGFGKPPETSFFFKACRCVKLAVPAGTGSSRMVSACVLPEGIRERTQSPRAYNLNTLAASHWKWEG